MTAFPLINSDHIGMIAACLTDNFLQPLYNFSNEKNYFGYLGTLSEINDWSHQFYSEYNHTLMDWETFQHSEDNIYHAVNWNAFLVAWGHNKMNEFFAENADGFSQGPG